MLNGYLQEMERLRELLIVEDRVDGRMGEDVIEQRQDACSGGKCPGPVCGEVMDTY
jgi:hypothetical protein